MTARDLDRIRFVTRHFTGLQGLRFAVPLGLITLSGGGTTYFTNRWFLLLRAALFAGGVLLALAASRYYRRTFGEVDTLGLAPVEAPESLSIYSPGGAATLLAAPPRETLALRRSLLLGGLALAAYVVLRSLAPAVGFEADESLVEAPWHSLRAGVFYFLPLQEPSLTPTMVKALFGQALYALCGALALGTWFARGRRFSQVHYLALGLPLLALAAVGASLGRFIGVGDDPAWITWILPALVHLWVALLLCGLALIVAGLLDHRQLVRALRRPGPAAAAR